jgi:2-keto-4-pentenoate hydratase/2-oxohepta-3-ene-1,7-dioic acid hydratase in catechol pathway
MKFFEYVADGRRELAVEVADGFRGLPIADPRIGGDLFSLIAAGNDALAKAGKALAAGNPVAMESVAFLPPIAQPQKIVCVGLNYRDHSSESGFKQPDYPTLFGRFNSSLVGHRAPIILPTCSNQLDYEGELVAVIGRTARNVTEAKALDHVAGYSIFNDASIRDYQFKAPQWTPGKNFDGTGAFGPFFVTSDALPRGCEGLTLQTRLNGKVVQEAKTDEMVFPVASLVSIISEFMTLVPGDLIVTGTPSGVGVARNPQLFMKDGDVCEVEVERIGVLSNPIRSQDRSNVREAA